MLCLIFILETPRTVNPVFMPFWGFVTAFELIIASIGVQDAET